jgi:hypothetical protein
LSANSLALQLPRMRMHPQRLLNYAWSVVSSN